MKKIKVDIDKSYYELEKYSTISDAFALKGLIEKDYIMIKNQDSISRDKILSLTTKGKKFCEETLILKEKFENEIIKFIGESNFKILKECLSEDWLID